MTGLGVLFWLEAKAASLSAFIDADGVVAEAFVIRRSACERAGGIGDMGREPLALEGEPWIPAMQVSFLIAFNG